MAAKRVIRQSKADAGGKRGGARRPARRWAKLIEAQRHSAYTVAEFCRRRRIAKATFWYWRKRLATATAAARPVSEEGGANFLAVPIVVPSAESIEVTAGTLRVRLEGTAAARIVDAIVGTIARGAER